MRVVLPSASRFEYIVRAGKSVATKTFKRLKIWKLLGFEITCGDKFHRGKSGAILAPVPCKRVKAGWLAGTPIYAATSAAGRQWVPIGQGRM
jgi:hypothetical protein